MSVCKFCELEKGELFTCQKCGKEICADCYNITPMHYCYECAQDAYFDYRRKCFKLGFIFVGLALGWLLSLVAFFVLVLFTEKGLPRWTPLIAVFVFFLLSFYPSWVFINEKIKRPGTVMLVIKLVLSLIGCVVIFPYYIITAIKNFKEAGEALNNAGALAAFPHPDPSKKF